MNVNMYVIITAIPLLRAYTEEILTHEWRGMRGLRRPNKNYSNSLFYDFPMGLSSLRDSL